MDLDDLFPPAIPAHSQAEEPLPLKVIEPDKDSLRIYTLPGGREKCLRVHGQDRYTDFDDPLVV